jgi:hypothetical protein
VRFGDFLRATVLLSAGAATLLATQTVIQVSRNVDPLVVYVSVAWWLGSVVCGLWLGRRAEATPPIARLLATAKMQTTLPELRPGLTLLNRLWLLLVSTLLAVIVAFALPQVAALAAGFAITWALAWRRQHSAVAAIEERDAVRFYVDRTSPLQGIRLIRTPGFGGSFLRVEGAREGQQGG